MKALCNTTNTTAEFAGRQMPYLIVLSLRIVSVATPIIIFTGIVGNFLSAVIFLHHRQRKTSCSLYLAARAVSDTGFLLCLLVPWLETVGHRAFHTWPLCQLTLYFTYVCGFLSVWFVVMVTVENYIRVCRPFSVQRFCTTRRAQCVIFVFLCISVVLYNDSLWSNVVVTAPDNRTVCRPNKRYQRLHSIVAHGDTLITLIVPSILIIAFMGTIIYRIFKTNMKATTSRTGANLQGKVTRMLFWVSFVFLVLNLPSHTIRIVLLVRSMAYSTRRVTIVEYFVQQMFHLVYYSSFAVNFILYISLGDSFRRIFVRNVRFIKNFSPSLPEYMTVPSHQTQNIELRFASTIKRDDVSGITL